MSVKIRLKRLGKVRVPQYRIVVVDCRKKRDGRVIEEIGMYHPKEDPSFIEVTSDRAQYWLGVGAQPTEAVTAILEVTGDWQTFKGLPGADGHLKTAEPKRDKAELFNEALKEAASEPRPLRRPRRPLRRRPRPSRRPPPRTPADREAGRGRRRGRGGRTTEKPAGTRPRRRRRPGRELTSCSSEALEHLVRGVVDNPDDVVVRDKQLRRGSLLEVRVHPDDLGKVIGRGGRTATAFRTVISALAGREGARIDFVDVDRR